MSADFELPIHAPREWQGIDFKGIVLLGAFFAYCIWRDSGRGDRQTLLGLPAILPPSVAVMVFSSGFHRLARVQSDGARYQLFAYAGPPPWRFFSTSRTRSSNRIPYYLESHVTPSGSGGVRGRPHPVGGLRFRFGRGPNRSPALGIQDGWNR